MKPRVHPIDSLFVVVEGEPVRPVDVIRYDDFSGVMSAIHPRTFDLGHLTPVRPIYIPVKVEIVIIKTMFMVTWWVANEIVGEMKYSSNIDKYCLTQPNMNKEGLFRFNRAFGIQGNIRTVFNVVTVWVLDQRLSAWRKNLWKLRTSKSKGHDRGQNYLYTVFTFLNGRLIRLILRLLLD